MLNEIVLRRRNKLTISNGEATQPNTVLIDDRLKTRVLVANQGLLVENPLNIADRYYRMEKEKQNTIKEG